MSQGKPYTDEQRLEIIEKICERMMDGESLKRICASDPSLPNKTTVIRWINDDKDNLAPLIARAREFQAECLDDEIQDITNRMLEGQIDPQSARVAIWAAQWRAARLKPKKYGDKIQQEHTSPDGSMTPQPTRIEIVAPSDDSKG